MKSESAPAPEPAGGERPLTEVAARQRVRLRSLGVNGPTARRLADLGLTIGSTATVVQTSSAAVVVAARGSRLALGHPLAAKLLVELTPEDEAL